MGKEEVSKFKIRFMAYKNFISNTSRVLCESRDILVFQFFHSFHLSKLDSILAQVCELGPTYDEGLQTMGGGEGLKMKIKINDRH